MAEGTGSPHYVVMVSSGAGSAMAWKRAVDRHGPENVTGLFADVNGENADNYRFLHEVMCWVAAPLVVLDNGGRTIWDVFRKERFLGNTRADNCSRVLKREVMRKWLEEHHSPAGTCACIGYDVDEQHRIDKARPNWLPYRLEAPLTWEPVLFKHEAHAAIEAAGIALPWLTRQGFPHANCGGGCVKAGHKQWRKLLAVDPAEFARWEAEEAAWQEAIGKNKTILRDRRKDADGIELSLREFRRRVQTENVIDFGQEDWGSCNCVGGWDDEGPAPEVDTHAITEAYDVEAYLLARYESPVTLGGYEESVA